MLTPLPLRDCMITDPFFQKRINMARNIAIPYMWEALNDRIPDIPKSFCIRNFRIAAGLEQGKFEGYVFQDSDLYKWLEAVAYSLETAPDDALERLADEAVDLVGKAQCPDGYLDTYYIIGGLDKRWTNLRAHHEMYVAGHMMEAAAAYFCATGKDKLLKIACRFADHIDSVFGAGEGKKRGYPGHQEIELGLVKLYRATGEKRYLDLAAFFLLERGKQPFYFDGEAKARGDEAKSFYRDHGLAPYCYQQAHKPVYEQTEAVGHAVREGYMLAGMADVASLNGDGRLLAASKTLFDNIVQRQMYITGGIGSMGDGEAFTFDYDLPNDRMYNETCASIALLMTAQRLGNIDPDAYYGDVAERTLYNGILSGVSLDGTRYFYVNPMEVWPERCRRRQDMGVDAQRQGWFGCACCPPNLLRTLTGLGQYIYALDQDTLYVHQYISSSAVLRLDGSAVKLTQAGNYPWEGRIVFNLSALSPVHCTLAFRVPGWCSAPALYLNGGRMDIQPITRKGYIYLSGTFGKEDEIVLDLPMQPQREYCSSHVPFNAGRVAFTRGPVVYCAEQADNGDQIWNLISSGGEIGYRFEKDLLEGAGVLTADGFREISKDDRLYGRAEKSRTPCRLTLVPYYAWCNRVPGEMAVWLREE